eukprot:g5469.t1
MERHISDRARTELASGGGAGMWAEINGLAKDFKAVNLGQGVSDFAGSKVARERAARAILEEPELNRYAPIGGLPQLTDAISSYYARTHGAASQYSAADEIVVTASGTEALYAIFQACVQPGDEVLLFEPYFPWYLHHVRLAGGTPVVVTLQPPRFELDAAAIAAKMSARTKLLLLNTPHNPTGHVATRAELEAIAALAQQHDCIVLADEVYENTVFESTGAPPHVRIATLPGMRERTLSVGSASKLFSLTGWRVGWVLGPEPLVKPVKALHGFSVYCAPAPLMAGLAAAFEHEDGTFEQVPALVERNAAKLSAALAAFGLAPCPVEGGFFLLADVSATRMNDYHFCLWCIRRVGVACIPLHVFYDREGYEDCTLVRFCIAKSAGTIERAVQAFGKATCQQLLVEDDAEAGSARA